MHRSRRLVAALAFGALLAAGACSSSDDPSSAADDTTSTTSTTTDAASGSETLRILVTNDDGIGAPGIDAVVDALSSLEHTEVIVAAPAENQSGSGSSTTPGGAEGEPGTTSSGYEGYTVDGTPADAVDWALDGGVDVTPHLVVSGLNAGQNLGAIGNQFSGTVGAARAATAKGIPSLASSMGIAEPIDYAPGVELVLAWVQDHREDLIAGTAAVVVMNLNVPSCPVGEVRGLVEVPMSDVGGEAALATPDCESTATDPSDDVVGFAEGFATLSQIATEPPG